MSRIRPALEQTTYAPAASARRNIIRQNIIRVGESLPASASPHSSSSESLPVTFPSSPYQPSDASPTTPGPAILGFDPGREKCGLAIVGIDGALHYHEVVSVAKVSKTIQQLRERYPVSGIVLGDQTGSKRWQAEIAKLPSAPRVTLVDERYSSLEARDRYWQMYPPTGLAKLIPQSLRSIPRPIDDIVAILLVERYLKRLSGKE